MKSSDTKLLQRLVEMSALAPNDLERVVQRHETSGARLMSDTLVVGGFARSSEVARAQASLGGFSFATGADLVADRRATEFVAPAYAVRHNVLPLRFDGDGLVVAMADPTDVYVCDTVARRAKTKLNIRMADPIELRDAIHRAYGSVDDVASRMSAEEIAVSRSEASAEARLAVQQTERAADVLQPPAPPKDDAQSSELEEANEFMLRSHEALRLSSGVHAVLPTRTSQRGAEHEVRTSAADLLNQIIEESLYSGAEAIEFAPLSRSVRLRARHGEVWRDLTPYPLKHHEPISQRVRILADALVDRRDVPVEKRFLLRTRRGDYACSAHFEPTAHGERILLRFPENAILFSDPLSEIGLPHVVAREIDGHMMRSGGGLLIVTTSSARARAKLLASLLRRYASAGRDAVLIDRIIDRELPGVTQISAPTTEVMLAALSNAAAMTPDLLVVGTIENGTALHAVCQAASRGITALACYQATSPDAAEASLRAARLEPMTIVRTMTGCLHAMEIARLCESCRRPLSNQAKSTLHSWAAGSAGLAMEAPGCSACVGLGRAGSVWASEYRTPDLAKADGSLTRIAPRDTRLDELTRQGLIDPRDAV